MSMVKKSEPKSTCPANVLTQEPAQKLAGRSPLHASFYSLDTVTVAQAMLGQILAIENEPGTLILSRIVETEAYTQDDPACHAYKKRGGRSEILYKQPGLSYVYFIYGMYYCLNAVTEPVDRAGAVLIRAVEPLYHAQGTDRLAELKTHGPGRLCKALNITKADHNEHDLTDPKSPIRVYAGDVIPKQAITTTTRIGIQQAKDVPWRFYITGNPYVSVKAKSP